MALAGLGTDVDVVTDIGLSFGLAREQRNLGNALARRLMTPRGGLAYDPEYGTDIRLFLNASLTPAGFANLKSVMVAECEKDPRVLAFNVDSFQLGGSGIAIAARPPLLASCRVETAEGPFDLILAISDATIELLDAAAPTPATPPDEIGGIVVIQGEQGPPGAAGPAGSGGQGYTLDQAAQMAVSSGAEETIFRAGIVDFGVLPASVTFEFTAQALALAGTGTFRVRVGGSADVPTTGTAVASFTATTGAFVDKVASATIANPGGQQFVKVTAQNSVVAQDARIRAVIVTVR